MNARPVNVDAYLAALPEDQRGALEALRKTTKAIAPDAAEDIAYAMPSFKYRGRPLAYYGAAKKHCALYGLVSEKHREELSAFETSKGTIRFAPDNPLPDSLIRKLISERMADIEATEAARKSGRRTGKSSY